MQTITSGTIGLVQRYWRMSALQGICLIVFGLLALVWPHLAFSLFVRIFGIFAIVEGCVLLGNAFTQSKLPSRGSEPHQRTAPYQRSTPPPQTETSYQTGMPPQGSEPYQRDPAYRAQSGETYQRDPAYQGGAAYQREASYQGEAAHRRETTDQRGRTHQGLAGRTGWPVLLIEGLVTVIVGILALALPLFIGKVLMYIIGIWALFKGISTLAQAPKRGWSVGVIGVLAIILALILFFNPIWVIRSAMWLIGLFALVMGVIFVLRSVQQHAAIAHQDRPVEPTY